jgi:AraC-like DNA-binding protein
MASERNGGPMFVTAEVRSYGAHVERHAHPHAQIIVPLDGVMEIEVEGRGDRLTTGVYAALDIGITHDFHAERGTHFLIIDLGEDTLRDNPEVARGLPFRQRVRPLNPRASRFLRYYAAELQRGSLADHPRQLLALSGLALLAEAPVAGSPRRHAARIVAAAHWIEAEGTARRAPTGLVTGIARRFALSRSHFGALFRREIGRSPKQYEIDLRLARACDLLRGSARSVSEIAVEVGYENVSSFTRTFTRRFGCTPSRYRDGHYRNGEK